MGREPEGLRGEPQVKYIARTKLKRYTAKAEPKVKNNEIC